MSTRIVLPLFGGQTWTVEFDPRDMAFPVTDVSRVTVQHLAHGLARVNRFSGQTPRAYSVAEHSVLLAEWLWKKEHSLSEKARSKICRACLLHDAGEALGIADAHGVLKKTLAPDLRFFEGQLVDALWRSVGKADMPFPAAVVKDHDRYLGDWEARFFGFPSSTPVLREHPDDTAPPWTPRCYAAEFVETLFLHAWVRYGGSLDGTDVHEAGPPRGDRPGDPEPV